jgi:hypothetical protein
MSERGQSSFKYLLYRLTMEKPLSIPTQKVCMTVWKLIFGYYTVSNDCMKLSRKESSFWEIRLEETLSHLLSICASLGN